MLDIYLLDFRQIYNLFLINKIYQGTDSGCKFEKSVKFLIEKKISDLWVKIS